jgi:hypothetical protein
VKQTKLYPVIFAVVAVNIAGILLRFYDLETYIIIVGFRFHLSFVLPFLIVFRPEQLRFIKKLFTKPNNKKTILPLLWILLPVVLIIAVLFLLKKINIGDPEYFYEFGLSSIVDYPIYLLWNFPQIIMLFIFLAVSSTLNNKKIIIPFLLIVLLFVFEFIPIGAIEFSVTGIVPLILMAVISGLIIKYFQNIYWFVILIFSVFWLHFLCFGSGSETIINLLFAARYNSWEGFFSVNKYIVQYLLPVQLLLTFLLVLISYNIHKRRVAPGF